MLSNLPPNLHTLTFEAMDAPSGLELREAIEDARWPLSITDIHFHEAESPRIANRIEEDGDVLHHVRQEWSSVDEMCRSRGIRLCGVGYLEHEDDDDDDDDGDESGGDSDDGGDADDPFALNSIHGASDDDAGSGADV